MLQIPTFSHAPIDIHSHFNHGSPYDCPDTIPDCIHKQDMAYLKEAYDHIGISQVGISTYASVLEHTECIFEENEYLFALSQKENWIYPWIVIDPRQMQTFAQAHEMLSSSKVLGIKIHPTYHGYDILEHGDAIFSFAAEHKAVVLMHPQHIEQMPRFADRYPDMNLIIAHLGSVEHVEAIRRARYGNIYTDTSAGASGLNHVIEYAVETVGAKKLLFGMDTYSFAFQLGRILLSHLSDADKESILYQNAMRLFPGTFS